MKKISFFALLSLSLCLTGQLFGQSFQVPQGYAFTTKEDYAKYQQQVIEAVNWLEQTPLNQEADKRKQVNAFLLKYLEGSPTVSIELKEYVMEFTQKNPDLLMAFMGGWAKHKLQNASLTDKVKLNTAGVKTVLKVYQLGGAIKDKSLEKLIKLTSDQELEEWVKSKAS